MCMRIRMYVYVYVYVLALNSPMLVCMLVYFGCVLFLITTTNSIPKNLSYIRESCFQQVNGYPNNVYKAFTSKDEADAFVRENSTHTNAAPSYVLSYTQYAQCSIICPHIIKQYTMHNTTQHTAQYTACCTYNTIQHAVTQYSTTQRTQGSISQRNPIHTTVTRNITTHYARHNTTQQQKYNSKHSLKFT